MKYIIYTFLIIFISCKEKQIKTTQRLAGNALGTSYNIIYVSDTSINLQNDVTKLFDTIIQVFSTYTEISEISKINQNKTYDSPSDMFKKVFYISKEIYKNTDGWFDPTVGILVKDLGLSSGKNYKLNMEKNYYKKIIGFDKINIENNILEKEHKDIFIDFNAIAKGYAVDYISEYLNKKNINNYLVEIGGEIIAKGEKINGEKWIIGIDKPKENLQERELDFIINLNDMAIATSGNYRKFIIDSLGNKIVHTINPKNLEYKQSNILSVSVIHSKCVYADAFATSLMACGSIDEIKKLVEKNNLDVYVIYLDKKNKPQKFITNGFKNLEKID